MHPILRLPTASQNPPRPRLGGFAGARGDAVAGGARLPDADGKPAQLAAENPALHARCQLCRGGLL
ncbi:MAG: hypothetical protein ACK559_26720, partial [bacterium]